MCALVRQRIHQHRETVGGQNKAYQQTRSSFGRCHSRLARSDGMFSWVVIKLAPNPRFSKPQTEDNSG